MRNVFDQYDQQENRVTHALLTAFNEDRFLLGRFLREVAHIKPPVPARQLSVLSQRYPGEIIIVENEEERRGIPDGWIFSINAEWCVFLEAKIQAGEVVEQVSRHQRTAERLGFTTVIAIAITRDLLQQAPAGTVLLQWRNVYEWLTRYRTRYWSAKAAEYLEITEAKLIQDENFSEGTLTMFAGFRFGPDHPYTYLEGKRTLLLACEALRANKSLQKQLGVNPRIEGRPAITGTQGDHVWDFLAISGTKDAAKFTHHPHLSLGVGRRAVDAMLTIPNAVNARARRALLDLGEDGFRTVIGRIVKNMKPLMRANPRMVPLVIAQQRRWRSMRARPSQDARIEFDLRTAISKNGPVVAQPIWLSAAYSVFARKHGANYELQVGALFPYEECPRLRRPSAINMIEKAWLACKPLVDIVR